MDDDDIDVEDGTVAESDDERDAEVDSENGVEPYDQDEDGEDADDNEEDDDEEEDDEEEEEEEDNDDDDDMDAAEDTVAQQRDVSVGAKSSPEAYISSVNARRQEILQASNYTYAKAYSIEPVGAAPHSSHVHTMAISGDGTNLLTGGSDGYVRRYDVYASMNGKAPLTQNVRHQYVDGVTKGGAMIGWWANEEIGAHRKSNVHNDDEDEAENFVSPVHSLAIQQDALWSLAGTQSGNINLTSLRHDPGQLRHVLRKHTSAVSAMALTSDDTELVSGGWDRSVHLWDLHTGKVVRSYPGHNGQITSLSFRPLQAGETYSVPHSPANISVHASAFGRSDVEGTPVDQEGQKWTPSIVRASSRGSDNVHNTPKRGSRTPSKNPKGDKMNPLKSEQSENELQQENYQGVSPSVKSTAGVHNHLTPKKEPDQSPGVVDGGDAGISPLFGDDADAGDEMDLEKDLNEALGLPGEMRTNSENIGLSMDDTEEMQRPATSMRGHVSMKGNNKDDSDGDSLFGSAPGSPDGEEDADGEDEDADGEDEDAEGEDDEPLASRPSARPLGIELPGQGGPPSVPPQSTRLESVQNAASSSTKDLQDGTHERAKPLPKPAFGSTDLFASYDADTSKFSNDILMSSTLGGQVAIWDRRVPSYVSGTTDQSKGKGVRSLSLPDKVPPWCMSACWSKTGDKIYIGRRNETIDEWDLRMIPDIPQTTGANGESRLERRGNARFVRSLRLPANSGPVTSVIGMPNSRHLLCGSYDNIRLWDTWQGLPDTSTSSIVPFRIVAGHQGATLSSMLLDASSRFFFTASGDRGWMSASTEAVLFHEVRGIF